MIESIHLHKERDWVDWLWSTGMIESIQYINKTNYTPGIDKYGNKQNDEAIKYHKSGAYYS